MIFFIFFFFIQGLLTLCICQQPHLPSLLLSLSLSSFRSYRIETPNWLSTNLCVVHFRRWTVCLELKPSMSVQRGKCDPGTNEPWNENSWKQWKWKQRTSHFLKNRTHQGIGRCLIEVQNPVRRGSKLQQILLSCRVHCKRGHKFSDCLYCLSFLSRPPQMFQKRLHQSQLQNHQDLELQVFRQLLCCGDLSSSSSVHKSGPTVGLVGLLLEKERMSDLRWFKWLVYTLCILFVT